MMLKKGGREKGIYTGTISNTMSEIEAVLNSWPLTYVYEDFESGFVLTPLHY